MKGTYYLSSIGTDILLYLLMYGIRPILKQQKEGTVMLWRQADL